MFCPFHKLAVLKRDMGVYEWDSVINPGNINIISLIIIYAGTEITVALLIRNRN